MFAAINEALSLWRGTPYTELEDAPAAQAERARLEELRVIALEDRAVAALGLGRHAVVAGELEVLTSTYPLRERLWGLRALALTRAGRQADALEVLREVRELLAEELGLEPGAELRSLQTAVLNQDPALEWTAARSIPRQRPPAVRVTQFAWPLVGRDDQLSALVGLLEQSGDRPAFAVVTGEPGIGKSRLCAELAATATAEGATVLVGRCSQDEGAPPLYPWASMLRELGHDLPSGSCDRGRRGQRLAVPGVGVDRPHPARRGRRAAPARHRRRPALGGHIDLAGAPPPRRDRGVGAADGGGDLAPRAAADRPARRGRRHVGQAPCAAAAPRRPHRGRGGRDRHLGGGDDPDGDGGRRAAIAHRRQPLLPGRVRPAGPRGGRPHRAPG